MEKKKTPKNKTKVQRVITNQYQYVCGIGNGDFQSGLGEIIGIHKLIKRDPKILLEKEVEHFSNLVKAFASENHFEHYVDSNLPAVLVRFIKTGRVDGSILNTRLEKPIDEFKEKESKDAKKPEQ